MSYQIKLLDLAGIVGGLTITFFGVAYVAEKFPLRLTPLKHLPATPLVPALGPGTLPSPPAKPQLMETPELHLIPGRRYGVALDTPALLPVSDSRVKEEAAKLGFTFVDVFSAPPKGWPGMQKSKADTWVVGMYSGPVKSLPRIHNTTAGSIDVIEAWEG